MAGGTRPPLRDVLADPGDDLGHGRARGEDARDAELEQLGAGRPAGMIPPPNTTMSDASSAASRSSTRANRVRCAPESTESPTASASSASAVATICSGRLVQPGVDDLHARVAQGAGDDLGAAVVPVEPGLGHHDAAGHRSAAVPRRAPPARPPPPWRRA